MVIKRNKVLIIHVTTWVNTENTTLKTLHKGKKARHKGPNIVMILFI